MGIHKLFNTYIDYRRNKINVRLTEIETNLSSHEQNIKALRIRRDSLVCYRSTMEQHDEFTRSTINLLKDEIGDCTRSKDQLIAEQTRLQARLKSLPARRGKFSSRQVVHFL